MRYSFPLHSKEDAEDILISSRDICFWHLPYTHGVALWTWINSIQHRHGSRNENAFSSETDTSANSVNDTDA